MILHTENLSPTQKEAIEQLLGRALTDQEAISLQAISVEIMPESQRLAAAEALRAFLKSPRKGPAVSDEEFEEAYLEAMRSVRPGYTEIV